MNIKSGLLSWAEPSIPRGSVFRVAGKYPDEQSLSLMVFEIIDERSYGLIATSGRDAGRILVRFPSECRAAEGGVNKKWLIENWFMFSDLGRDISQIYLGSRYSAYPSANPQREGADDAND